MSALSEALIQARCVGAHRSLAHFSQAVDKLLNHGVRFLKYFYGLYDFISGLFLPGEILGITTT